MKGQTYPDYYVYDTSGRVQEDIMSMDTIEHGLVWPWFSEVRAKEFQSLRDVMPIPTDNSALLASLYEFEGELKKPKRILTATKSLTFPPITPGVDNDEIDRLLTMLCRNTEMTLSEIVSQGKMGSKSLPRMHINTLAKQLSLRAIPSIYCSWLGKVMAARHTKESRADKYPTMSSVQEYRATWTRSLMDALWSAATRNRNEKTRERDRDRGKEKEKEKEKENGTDVHENTAAVIASLLSLMQWQYSEGMLDGVELGRKFEGFVGEVTSILKGSSLLESACEVLLQLLILFAVPLARSATFVETVLKLLTVNPLRGNRSGNSGHAASSSSSSSPSSSHTLQVTALQQMLLHALLASYRAAPPLLVGIGANHVGLQSLLARAWDPSMGGSVELWGLAASWRERICRAQRQLLLLPTCLAMRLGQVIVAWYGSVRQKEDVQRMCRGEILRVLQQDKDKDKEKEENLPVLCRALCGWSLSPWMGDPDFASQLADVVHDWVVELGSKSQMRVRSLVVAAMCELATGRMTVSGVGTVCARWILRLTAGGKEGIYHSMGDVLQLLIASGTLVPGRWPENHFAQLVLWLGYRGGSLEAHRWHHCPALLDPSLVESSWLASVALDEDERRGSEGGELPGEDEPLGPHSLNVLRRVTYHQKLPEPPQFLSFWMQSCESTEAMSAALKVIQHYELSRPCLQAVLRFSLQHDTHTDVAVITTGIAHLVRARREIFVDCVLSELKETLAGYDVILFSKSEPQTVIQQLQQVSPSRLTLLLRLAIIVDASTTRKCVIAFMHGLMYTLTALAGFQIVCDSRASSSIRSVVDAVIARGTMLQDSLGSSDDTASQQIIVRWLRQHLGLLAQGLLCHQENEDGDGTSLMSVLDSATIPHILFAVFLVCTLPVNEMSLSVGELLDAVEVTLIRGMLQRVKIDVPTAMYTYLECLRPNPPMPQCLFEIIPITNSWGSTLAGRAYEESDSLNPWFVLEDFPGNEILNLEMLGSSGFVLPASSTMFANARL